MPQLDVLPRREFAEAFARLRRFELNPQHVCAEMLYLRDGQGDDAIRMREGFGRHQDVVARQQIVFHCVTNLPQPFQGQHRVDGWESDGVRGAGVGARGAAHHAVHGIDDNGLLTVEFKAVDQATATRDACAATDACVLNDAGVPVDLVAWHTVPGLGELRIGHACVSVKKRMKPGSYQATGITNGS